MVSSDIFKTEAYNGWYCKPNNKCQKEEVLNFLDFLVKKTEPAMKPAKKLSRKKKKFKFDWEGGLADMQDYTSIELQHKAMGYM